MRFYLLFLLVTLVASPAYAYIGPGLGVAAIWALFGPIAAIVTTVLVIAYFPARYYYKKYKHEKANAEKASATAQVDNSDAASE